MEVIFLATKYWGFNMGRSTFDIHINIFNVTVPLISIHNLFIVKTRKQWLKGEIPKYISSKQTFPHISITSQK